MMLKEEKELRKYIKAASDEMCTFQPAVIHEMYPLIAALVRAVREDCAKVAERYTDGGGEYISDAIRSKK